LLRQSFNIASLSAQVKNKLEAKAQRPRRTFISASTTAYRYAAYMEAWRAKVERVGNLNYPDEARKRKLSGNLILDVALNPDGSVNDIVIRRSSGHKILDDAAIRIVHLAAPFSPFPADIRKDTDILHITRTWQFINNKGFR
jgi:protein TonB